MVFFLFCAIDGGLKSGFTTLSSVFQLFLACLSWSPHSKVASFLLQNTNLDHKSGEACKLGKHCKIVFQKSDTNIPKLFLILFIFLSEQLTEPLENNSFTLFPLLMMKNQNTHGSLLP